VRVLSRRFGLSKDAIHRHRRLHLSEQLVAALLINVKGLDPIELEHLRKSESEGLLSSLIRQRARLELLSQMAFDDHAVGVANQIEHSICRSLELTARLVGELAIRHEHVAVNFLITPSYLRLRQALMSVLRKYPDAAAGVARELGALELEAAEEIKQAKHPPLLEAAP
jgi:hypothetical protein